MNNKLNCFGETLSDFRSNPNEDNAVFETIVITKQKHVSTPELFAIHNREFFADKQLQTLHEPIGMVKVKHYEKDTFWTPNYRKDAEKYALEYLSEIGVATKINETIYNEPGYGSYYLNK